VVDFFWMKHPGIEKAASIPETAVAFWAERGWVQVEGPDSELPTEPPTEPQDEPVTTTRARRRPATTEE